MSQNTAQMNAQRQSEYRQKRNRKKRRRKIIRRIILILVLLVLVAAGSVAGYVAYVIKHDAEQIDTNEIYAQINQRTVVFDDRGKEISTVSVIGGNRTLLEYGEIPYAMRSAIVSLEDKTFWTHHGFNFRRMVGAVLEKLRGGGQISGTSTITQQLARNIYLADVKSERSIHRKILEAYYTVQLEQNMTKEQILEAYLNTVYFGYDCYGISAAADYYFGKDAQNLDILESAALAALPQSPDTYALVKISYGDNESNLPVLKEYGDYEYLYNGDLTESRRNTAIKLMKTQGYISNVEKQEALEDDLKTHIKIGGNITADANTYYIDYCIQKVTEDLMEQYNMSEADASRMVYSGGLKIYTYLDTDIQKKLTHEIDKDSNYVELQNIDYDSHDNIVNDDGKVILRPYSRYFTSKGTFVLKKGEYAFDDNGNMIIKHGGRLALTEANADGVDYVRIGFRSMYKKTDDDFYIIESGDINMPSGYTHFNNKENCVVSAQFFEDYPDIFVKDGNKYRIRSENITLSQKVAQPQAAATIMENSSGEIKAMSGGRDCTGRNLYNRAVNPQQPGSNIKPLAVYGAALQRSVDLVKDDKSMNLKNKSGDNFGQYITAGSVINDAPTERDGKIWPKNAGGTYQGSITLRNALRLSINVVAVKIFDNLPQDYVVDTLKDLGISTIDEEGDYNDLNAAALALGGMTHGISPLELTAAYATFPNEGIYKEPKFYSEVVDDNEDVILTQDDNEHRVFDKGVAWIMTDMMQGVVKNGTGTAAALDDQPVGGKTGTTSDQYDIWFTGFTPQYTMSLWEGSDVNIQLTSMSSAAADFWSDIMEDVCDGLSTGSFPERPDNVQWLGNEYYVKGTIDPMIFQTTTTTAAPTDASGEAPSGSDTSDTTAAPATDTTAAAQ